MTPPVIIRLYKIPLITNDFLQNANKNIENMLIEPHKKIIANLSSKNNRHSAAL